MRITHAFSPALLSITPVCGQTHLDFGLAVLSASAEVWQHGNQLTNHSTLCMQETLYPLQKLSCTQKNNMYCSRRVRV